VEKIQEIYLEALRAYVEYLHPVRPGVNFAKLLSVLTELRTLGNINSEMCFSLKLKNRRLPPFLAEIWDVTTWLLLLKLDVLILILLLVVLMREGVVTGQRSSTIIIIATILTTVLLHKYIIITNHIPVTIFSN